jgi:hypothetical protein
MSDEIDRANEHAEMLLQDALRKRMPEGPKATGFCLHCDDPLPRPQRWCSVICRNHFEATSLRPRR